MKFKLLFYILLFTSFQGFSEILTSSSIRNQFLSAINFDIYIAKEEQRERKIKSSADSINNCLNNINKIFESPFSYDSVNIGLGMVEDIIGSPHVSRDQIATAKQLYNNLCQYGAVAGQVRDKLNLSSSNKNFNRVGELLQMEEMAPVYIEFMASDIKNAFSENGLFNMDIDKSFSYLNAKIKYVNDSLSILADNPKGNPKDLMLELRNVLNVVNEIDTDSPHTEILLDQEFIR